MTEKEARQLKPGSLLKGAGGKYFLITPAGIELLLPADDKLRFSFGLTTVPFWLSEFVRTGVAPLTTTEDLVRLA